MKNRAEKGQSNRQTQARLNSIDYLTKTIDEKTLLQMIENDAMERDLLALLSFHGSARVRAAVADNPRMPYVGLLKLAIDESPDVRFQIAENHNVPITVLRVLVEDENPYVSERAIKTLERVRSAKERFSTTGSFRAVSIH